MHWLLIGYMFLFVDRPFEVWPWLGDIHLERLYMLFTLAVWLVYPGKRWLPDPLHVGVAALALAVVLSWLLSPWSERGQPVVEDWFKIVVFFVLLTTTVHTAAGLRRLVVGFVIVLGLYQLHSLREYLGGRHTYRMGIARMIGVDSTMGDPNSFGATLVVALPLAWAVWQSGWGGRGGRLALMGYAALSGLCVLLTGSRSALLGLLAFASWFVWRSRRRWIVALSAMVVAPLVGLALPESLQNRFLTIIDPSVGPRNAQESGQGRIEGFFTGLDLWQAYPLCGVGPGAWRPATGSKLESHNLYGQLLGELGTVGLVAFLGLLVAFRVNWRRLRRLRQQLPEGIDPFPFLVAQATAVAVALLLLLGMFGHNLFRYNWLWYAGFLIIARHVAERQAYAWEQSLEEAAALTPECDTHYQTSTAPA
ncbi:MAG: O-antigen ligase family protein [Gemmataceae bacterium]|nr:O-antigen ligase family protein [Gemmataceae bacterium]